MMLRALPTQSEHVTEQLQKAMDAHIADPYTDIVILAMRHDGATRSSSLWYAPEQRVSQIVGLLECAKVEMILEQRDA